MSSIVALRLVHILAGTFWAGVAVFMAAFLVPSIRAAGPAGAAVMRELIQVRRLTQWLMLASWLTLLSGLGLVHLVAGALGHAWFGVGVGRWFGAGAVTALVAMIIGHTVNVPTARRIGALGAAIQAAGAPPSPEQQGQMQALQQRMTTAARVVASLLALATALMAVARYLG